MKIKQETWKLWDMLTVSLNQQNVNILSGNSPEGWVSVKINTILIKDIYLLWILAQDQVFQVLFVCSGRTKRALANASCLEYDLV